MPRFVYILIFIAVAILPFIFFAALSRTPSSYGGTYGGSHYRSGSSFYFFSFGDGSRSRGRGFSSGGFQGGGSRFGK